MSIRIFPPPAELAPLVMHALCIDLNCPSTHIPAALSPSVIWFPSGGGHVFFPDGRQEQCPSLYLLGPFDHPFWAHYQPGTRCISVCFRPGMLNEAVGILPATILSQAIPLQQIMPAHALEAFFERVRHEHSAHAQVQAFFELLRGWLNIHRMQGMGAAFLQSHQKLFFPLLDLVEHFGIGQRQLERRVRNAFGFSLRDLRRLSRFGLSLPLFMERSMQRGDLTRLAHDAGYYDQAHMHRDFVELAGIAPQQLQQKIARQDPAYWLYTLDVQAFRNAFIPV